MFGLLAVILYLNRITKTDLIYTMFITHEQIAVAAKRNKSAIAFKETVEQVNLLLAQMCDEWTNCENLNLDMKTDCQFPFNESLDDIAIKFNVWATEINK